ncbi:MAG: hypothetical protein WCK90_02420 [archaeon]
MEPQEGIPTSFSSGVYISGHKGELMDLVYNTSDEEFMGFLRERGLRVAKENPDAELTERARYSALELANLKGIVINKVRPEWEEFVQRMKAQTS